MAASAPFLNFLKLTFEYGAIFKLINLFELALKYCDLRAVFKFFNCY